MVWLRRRGPTISHLHLSERGSFVREGGLAALAAALGNPVVQSMHGADLPEFIGDHPRLVRAVLHTADVVIALGPRTADLVSDVAPDVRVEIVPNPVELPEEIRPMPEGPPMAVFAGDVGLRKGADVLVEAWRKVYRKLPGAQLVIAGRPDDVAIDELPGLRLLGPVSRAQVGDLLERATLAVLPSRREVMPMFLLEAMARGRTVVSTPVGDVEDLVGDAGVIVPAANPTALADALVDLLSDPEECERRGLTGRRRVEGRFSPAAVAQRLETVYASVG
jgi:glycosyltransferase involved in cell wall biosynthesis